jgi:hypothetical protein
MKEPSLKIGDRIYHKVDYGIFKVAVDDLQDLRIGDLPPHSSILVVGLPSPPDDHEFYLTVTNGGGPGDVQYLNVFGCVTFASQADAVRKLRRLRRAYLPMVECGDLPDAFISPPRPPDRFGNGPAFSLDFAGKPDAIVREAIEPVLCLFRKLSGPEFHFFICHASEDKSAAHEVASCLQASGVNVWLDQWEIRVGDSIVERINSGLSSASHLLVLLSKHSVVKPWVKRELSSAIMRQLRGESVVVLPVLLDECEIPPILSDIRYADCRAGISGGIAEILRAIVLESGA